MTPEPPPDLIEVTLLRETPAKLLIQPKSEGYPLKSVTETVAGDAASAYEALAKWIKKRMGFDIPSENWSSAFANLRLDGKQVSFTKPALYEHSLEYRQQMQLGSQSSPPMEV